MKSACQGRRAGDDDDANAANIGDAADDSHDANEADHVDVRLLSHG